MDYSYDPCSCIDEIDFDNINDLKKNSIERQTYKN